jgi:hypothetical protein
MIHLQEGPDFAATGAGYDGPKTLDDLKRRVGDPVNEGAFWFLMGQLGRRQIGNMPEELLQFLRDSGFADVLPKQRPTT